MKNSIKLVALALVVAATSFSGCKKGENDPFISLKSRKSRVAGDWKITSGSGTDVSGTNTTTWTYDGATYTQTNPTASFALAMTYTFEKDGTFKSNSLESSTGYSQTTDETGTWNFTSGVGEMKNKSQIVIMTLSSTQVTVIGTTSNTTVDTYTGDNAPTAIYDIDQLKSKEMIWKWKGSYNDGAGSSSSTEGMMTATSQ